MSKLATAEAGDWWANRWRLQAASSSRHWVGVTLEYPAVLSTMGPLAMQGVELRASRTWPWLRRGRQIQEATQLHRCDVRVCKKLIANTGFERKRTGHVDMFNHALGNKSRNFVQTRTWNGAHILVIHGHQLLRPVSKRLLGILWCMEPAQVVKWGLGKLDMQLLGNCHVRRSASLNGLNNNRLIGWQEALEQEWELVLSRCAKELKLIGEGSQVIFKWLSR